MRLCVPRPFSIPTTPRSSPGIASPLPDKFIQRQASKQNVSNCSWGQTTVSLYFFWRGVGESNSHKFYQETLKKIEKCDISKVATTCPLFLSWIHITLKIHNSDRPKHHKLGTSFFKKIGRFASQNWSLRCSFTMLYTGLCCDEPWCAYTEGQRLLWVATLVLLRHAARYFLPHQKKLGIMVPWLKPAIYIVNEM